MHGASLGYFEQARALLFIERPRKRYESLYAADGPLFDFAGLTVFGMNTAVGEAHLDFFERPAGEPEHVAYSPTPR